MMIQTVCACGRKVTVNEDMAGEVVQCIRCGRQVAIPAKKAPPPPPEEKPVEVEKSAAPAAPVPDESAREYVYLLLVFALVPLIFLLGNTEQQIEFNQRFDKTISSLEPDRQKHLREIKEMVEYGEMPLDTLINALPEQRMVGAFLPRETDVHWLFVLASAVGFWLVLCLCFTGTTTKPHHLLGVGLFTATMGVSFLLVAHFFGPVAVFIEFCMMGAHSDMGDFLTVLAGFTLGVGFFEELAKLLPLVWYFHRYRRISWRRACLWGLASGAGFGVAEGWLYSAEFYNGIEGMDIYLVRFISCVALHAIWTASAGMALFFHQDLVLKMLRLPPPEGSHELAVRTERLPTPLRTDEPIDWFAVLLVAIKVLAVVMFLHGLYDAALTRHQDLLALGTAVVSFGWLTWLVEAARREEAAPAAAAA